jgi:sigma-E factor negative regulatory protein RseA
MEKLSALMDGELDTENVSVSLKNVCEDEHWRRKWDTYHLIGDCLRRDGHVPCDVSRKILADLASEPTVLAPRNGTSSTGRRRVAMALAASAAGVALVAWVAFMHNPLLPSPSVVVVAPMPAGMARAVVKTPAAQPVAESEYLTAHQQVSPSTVVRGVASYVYTVSASDVEAERQ